jgi:hypothetical protein
MMEIAELIEKHGFYEAVKKATATLKEYPQANIETIHHFCGGVYMREIRIPAGTMLIGKIHKKEHLCILNGDIEIVSNDVAGHFSGYLTFVSKPGVQRIGYALADTVFTSVHAIDYAGKSIQQLEHELTVETLEEYQQFLTNEVGLCHL